MSDKKHIDRIFQEKLKDFEVSPNPELWTKIQNELKLEDNQPKKVFPIWLRLASVAAVLALLFTIGYFVFDSNVKSDAPSTQTVDTNNTTSPSQDNLNNFSLDENDNNVINSELTDNPETSTANLDENEVTDNAQNKSVNNANTSKSTILNTDNNSNKIVSKNNNNSSNKSVTDKNTKLSNSETKVANTSGVVSSNNDNNAPELNKVTSDSRTASNNPNSTNNINNSVSSNSEVNKTTQTESNSNPELNKTNTNTRTASNNPNTTNNINNNVSSNPEVNKTAQTESNSNPELDTDAANRALENENTQNAIALNAMKGDKSLNEKEKENSLKVGDSLLNESPSIEEAIAQAEELNEKEEEKEKLVNRWQVYANVAPVYYNSLGQGSHIDDQFVSNSKSGEVNMSYGVNVSYALSKKLAIRSGVSSLNLSYDTDNVILYENPSGNGNPVNPMRNINLAPESQSLNAFSGENLGFQQNLSDLSNAAISQRLSYYEVPVELEYKLVNKRFGVNLIGGVSTFFLNNNEVYSEFEEYTTFIGEANNVNSVSFSTNLGLGMNYKFSEKFKFNLEPTFKYQLNAFSNTSGSFRPYIIGVYTGFSYKF